MEGRGNGRSWVTHDRIDENPGLRGHDLCFDKTCQGNHLAKHAEVGKYNDSNKDLAVV